MRSGEEGGRRLGRSLEKARDHGSNFVWLCVLAVLGALPAFGQGRGNSLLWPSAVAYDAAGNLYIADSGRNQVFEATLAGSLLVVAGTGTQGDTGDGGAAGAAQLNDPEGVAVGPDGTIYVADTGNARIRAIAGGSIRTLAGTGVHAFGGDGGVPTGASFRTPAALALDGTGGLLVCDTADHRVRRVDLAAGGLLSTVAGTGVQGYAGDGGAATAAELDSPGGVAVASDGRLFIADTHNRRVRVVSAAGTITTFAGNGVRGGGGDGGPAPSAQFIEPRGLAIAGSGALWIGDAGTRRVRQVSPGGVISTLAGSGVEGAGVDGDAPTATLLRTPRALAVSSFGQLVIADTLNGTVRVVTAGSAVYQPAALVTGRAGSSLGAAVPPAQVYGSPSVAVSVSGPIGTPQGTVILSEGGINLGSAVLNGGSAAIAGWIASAGSHIVSLTYSGDGLNAAVSSSPLPVVVSPLPITAVANSASVVYGAPSPGLTGVLQGVLNADMGQVTAVFTVTAGALPPVGTYPISAALTGSRSGNYRVSMAANSGSLRILPAGSLTSLGTVAGGYAGLPLRLTANVASSTGGQPTGTVTFLDGGTAVATGMLVNGSASAILAAPTSGEHPLTAAYGGDANFLASSSAVQLASVGTLPDFAVSLSGSSSVTVSAGASATFQLVVGAAPAPFTGDVTLAVTGLPTGATAVFSPVQVVPGTGSAPVTLTVQTPASQASLPSSRHQRAWLACLWVAGLFGFRRGRRVGARLSLLAFCLVITGCGARTVGEGSKGPTTRTYPLQITGTSTNLLGGVVTHSTSATLIVQQ